MKKWRVSRTFCTSISWIVEAETEKEALAMLDDDEKTPTLLGDETYLGGFESLGLKDLQDNAEELEEEK